MRSVAVTIFRSRIRHDGADHGAMGSTERFRGSRSVDVSSAYATDIVYDRRAWLLMPVTTSQIPAYHS